MEFISHHPRWNPCEEENGGAWTLPRVPRGCLDPWLNNAEHVETDSEPENFKLLVSFDIFDL